jgi:hypothetical protein
MIALPVGVEAIGSLAVKAAIALLAIAVVTPFWVVQATILSREVTVTMS